MSVTVKKITTGLEILTKDGIFTVLKDGSRIDLDKNELYFVAHEAIMMLSPAQQFYLSGCISSYLFNADSEEHHDFWDEVESLQNKFSVDDSIISAIDSMENKDFVKIKLNEPSIELLNFVRGSDD